MENSETQEDKNFAPEAGNPGELEADSYDWMTVMTIQIKAGHPEIKFGEPNGVGELAAALDFEPGVTSAIKNVAAAISEVAESQPGSQ